jgi:hypothetical protein
MNDELVVEYTPASGPRRRTRFAKASSRSECWRVTEVYAGCHWRVTGRERVSDLEMITTD